MSDNAANETQSATDPAAAGHAEHATGAGETTTNVAVFGAAADAGIGTLTTDAVGSLSDAAFQVDEGIRAQREAPVTLKQGQLDDLKANLDELERIALFWGGERGTQMRNLVCRSRFDIFGK